MANPIFLVYSSYFYTDTLVMPLCLLAIFICTLLDETNENKFNLNYCLKNIILSLSFGVIVYFAFKIRAVGIFLLLAYLISMLFTAKFKTLFLRTSVIVLGLILSTFCYKTINDDFYFKIDESRTFPATHWIMMGLNTETGGYFSEKDYSYTNSNIYYETKKTANLEVIISRIDNMNLRTFVNLMSEKIKAVWSYGHANYDSYLTLIRNYDKKYQYISGNKTIYIDYLIQISHSLLLLMLVICIVMELKQRKNSNKQFIYISLFGALLFYLIWEVQPRYSLAFIPWIVVLISIEIGTILSFRTSKLNMEVNVDDSSKKIKVNIDRVSMINKVLLLVLTLIMFFINYSYYTKEYSMDERVVASSYNHLKVIKPLNKDNSYLQEFVANLDFNKIYLSIDYSNYNQKFEYNLELLDSKKNVINSFVLTKTNDDLAGNNIYIFNKIESDGDRYYIRLTSNAPAKYSIGVKTTSYYNYDYYPAGEFFINGKTSEGDLLFKVVHKKKRARLSKKEYLLTVFIVLLFEIFVLFSKEDILKISNRSKNK